jgi:hypothetical protein
MSCLELTVAILGNIILIDNVVSTAILNYNYFNYKKDAVMDILFYCIKTKKLLISFLYFKRFELNLHLNVFLIFFVFRETTFKIIYIRVSFKGKRMCVQILSKNHLS